MWERRLRAVFGDAADELILEGHRKAVYQGGTIADCLAQIYADAVEAGVEPTN
jgi:hypothetical protein